jgi:hypothetical protein
LGFRNMQEKLEKIISCCSDCSCYCPRRHSMFNSTLGVPASTVAAGMNKSIMGLVLKTKITTGCRRTLFL